MRFTPTDYRAYVQISQKRHLLVEGRDDKRAFKVLLDEVDLKFGIGCSAEIDIDTASDLVEFSSPLGNREKVEHIAASISGRQYAERFVAFVDREFREFRIGNVLEDFTSASKIVDRLIWSRGHSLENYYFNLEILRAPFRDLSVIPDFDKALNLLDRVFESAIRMACAASLTGLELDLLWLVKNCIHWQTLRINNEAITFDVDDWKKRLQSQGPPGCDTAMIVERFEHWRKIVEGTGLEIARFLCHGHIGFSYIWAAYARCVYEVTNNATEVTRVLRADESLRLNATASSWARFFRGSHNYPCDVLRLLAVPHSF